MSKQPPFFLNYLSKYKFAIVFIILLAIGSYLRFWHINSAVPFGWDQGRDAYVVRDIIKGKVVFDGPRTGIGNFHLGPSYYYLLVPFFLLTKLDPVAENYFNILINAFNFAVVFWVVERIFDKKWATFAVFIYAFSNYLIKINQVPWNVSLMPGVVFLIFYAMYQVLLGKTKWLIALFGLWGFLFHIHFTAVFLSIPIGLVALIAIFKQKKELIKLILISIPVFAVWFIPNLLFNLTQHSADIYSFKNFLRYYFIGFHLRFLLHRLPDDLIIFETLIFFPFLKIMKFILPAVFSLVGFFEKDAKMRKVILICFLWLLGPIIGFTVYGGPLSDYYFLMTLPVVFMAFIYLQKKLLGLHFTFIVVFVIFWAIWAFYNSQSWWVKPISGGLNQQREKTLGEFKSGIKRPYVEGDIRSYFFVIWNDRK